MPNLLLLRNDFESSKFYLDPWLSYMFDCIHICVFLFLKNVFKQSRHLLGTSRYQAYLLSFLVAFYRNLNISQ